MRDEIRSEEGPIVRDHSTTTRQEALTASLKPRRPPQPDREFSTLVVALPTAECRSECHWDSHGDPVHVWMTGDPCPHAENWIAGLRRVADELDGL